MVRDGMAQVVLKDVGEDDLPSLQALFEACEEYFIRTTGGPASPAAAHSVYIQLPEGRSYADKHIFGMYEVKTSELLGVIDAIVGYPERGTLMLGLFLVVPHHRRRGVGENAYVLLEQWGREQGVSTIRVGVYAGDEEAMSFWEQVGFRATGQTLREGTRAMVVLEKLLSESTNDGV